MSALPLKADVLSLGIYVCFVPEADYSGRCRRSDRPKSFRRRNFTQGLQERTSEAFARSSCIRPRFAQPSSAQRL